MINFEFRAIGTAEELRPYLQLALGNTSTGALTVGGTMQVHGVGAIAGDDETGPPNPNAPQFDTAGLPWDERIHSTKKAQTGDGAWRKRRGVDAVTIAAVEAELKARGAHFTPPPGSINNPPPNTTASFTPPAITMPTNLVPVPPMQPTYPGQPQMYQQPGPPPMYQPQQYPPTQQPPQYVQQPAPPPQLDLNGFMAHLSGQMGKRDAAGMPVINIDYLARVTQELSQATGRPINHIAEIGGDPNAINAAINILMRDGKWQ